MSIHLNTRTLRLNLNPPRQTVRVASLVSLLITFFLAACVTPAIHETGDVVRVSQQHGADIERLLPQDFDTIAVQHPRLYAKYDARHVVWQIDQAGLREQLADILEVDTRNTEPQGKHACRGTADILFVKDKQVVRKWNFAHGHFFWEGFLTPASESALANWFDAKGFERFKTWIKTPDENGLPPPVSPTTHALQYLAKSQNPDGSWDTGNQAYLTTSLALMAFLNMGETPDSGTYGTNLVAACNWLTGTTPVTEDDKMIAVHVLTSLLVLKRQVPDQCHAIDAEALGNKIALLANAGTSLSKPYWADLASLTAFPPEVPRPKWLEDAETVVVRWQNATNPILANLDNEENLLTAYMTTLARETRSAREEWSAYNKAFVLPMNEAQTQDGSFPVRNLSSSRSTAFFVMIQSVYYKYWCRFVATK